MAARYPRFKMLEKKGFKHGMLRAVEIQALDVTSTQYSITPSSVISKHHIGRMIAIKTTEGRDNAEENKGCNVDSLVLQKAAMP